MIIYNPATAAVEIPVIDLTDSAHPDPDRRKALAFALQ